MSRKQIVISVSIVAIVLAAALGLWANTNWQSVNILDFKDPGLTQEELQERAKAISEIKEKLKDKNLSKEDRYKLQMQLGLTLSGVGKYAEAKKELLKASGLFPDNPTPYGELYVVSNARQDYKSAKKYIEKAISLMPSSQQFWRWRLELEKGPLQATKERMKELHTEALKATNEYPDIVVLYAEFLKSIGDLPGAVAQYKKAIEKNPAGKAQYEQEIQNVQESVK